MEGVNDMKKKKTRRFLLLIMIVAIALLTLVKRPISIYAAEEKEMDTIDCPYYSTGESSEYDNMQQFKLTIPSAQYELIIPVHVVSKGVMNAIFFSIENEQNAASNKDEYKLKIALYEDLNCTRLMEEKECSSFLGVNYETMKIPQEGIYYLKISLMGRSETTDLNLCFMPSLIKAANRDLIENVWAYAASFDDKAVYYKINAEEDGYFTISADLSEKFSTKELTISLCDSTMKSMSKTCCLSSGNSQVMYGVTKGIYYIKVVNPTLPEKNQAFTDYRVNYDFTGIIDCSGNSIKTAKYLYWNRKPLNGIQTIANNSEDWFKVKVTKPKNVTITIDKTIVDGDFLLVLYDANKKPITLNSTTICNNNQKNTVYTTGTKLKAGTYYIKVIKSASKVSGYYNIKAN